MDPSLQTNTLNPSSQNSTQNPQIAGTSNSDVEHASGVQPGTASALLENVNGISLNTSSLPSVNLDSGASTSSSVNSKPFEPLKPKHHVNAVLLGFALLLLVVAVASFWAVGRSVKNTT